MKRLVLYSLLTSLVLGQAVFAFPQKAFADPGDTLRIHATPPVPTAFQRVYLTIDVPTYRDGGILKTENPDYPGLDISWLINGYSVDVCHNSTYCSVMMGAAGNRFDVNNTQKFLVHVSYSGENEIYSGSMTITPVINDIGQRDNFTQSMDCSAQSLDMLAGDIDRMEQMIDDTVFQIENMVDQLDEDITFLTGMLDFETTFDSMMTDYYNIKKSIIAIGSVDTVQGALRASAQALRTIVQVYLKGNVAQEIAHFQKIKKRYENMGKTLTAMKNARLRYVKNMTNQLERQKALCDLRWSKVNTHGL